MQRITLRWYDDYDYNHFCCYPCSSSSFFLFSYHIIDIASNHHYHNDNNDTRNSYSCKFTNEYMWKKNGSVKPTCLTH